MNNELESILSERFVSFITAAVLIYIFFWWKGRKKKKTKVSGSETVTATEGQEKEEGPLKKLLSYLGWRFKLAIIVFIIWAVLYFVFNLDI